MEIEDKKYTRVLKGGQELYVPMWPASVALQNLTRAGQFIGAEELLQIAELSIPAVMRAILNSETPKDTIALIKHFVCTARMDGSKIQEGDFDSMFEGNLLLAVEVFAHVVYAQYHSFFVQGLAKEASLEE